MPSQSRQPISRLTGPYRMRRRSENKRTANVAIASFAKGGGAKQKPICRDFLPDNGCNKGGQCTYQHPQTVGRCLRYGSTKHQVSECKWPRKDAPSQASSKGKGRGKGPPLPKDKSGSKGGGKTGGGSTGSTTRGQQQGQPKGNPRQRRGRNRSPNPKLRLSHPLIRLKRVLPLSPGLRTMTVTPLLLALQILQFLLPGVSPWTTLPMHVPSMLPSALPSTQVSLWMIKAFCPPFSRQALHTAFCP